MTDAYVQHLEEEICGEIRAGATAVAAYMRGMSQSAERRAAMIGLLRRMEDEALKDGQPQRATILRKAICFLMLDS